VVNVCQLYGYEYIGALAFENTGLFARSVGEETDIIDKQSIPLKTGGTTTSENILKAME
jgi:histidyl-tRNA synthetase